MQAYFLGVREKTHWKINSDFSKNSLFYRNSIKKMPKNWDFRDFQLNQSGTEKWNRLFFIHCLEIRGKKYIFILFRICIRNLMERERNSTKFHKKLSFHLEKTHQKSQKLSFWIHL